MREGKLSLLRSYLEQHDVSYIEHILNDIIEISGERGMIYNSLSVALLLQGTLKSYNQVEE